MSCLGRCLHNRIHELTVWLDHALLSCQVRYEICWCIQHQCTFVTSVHIGLWNLKFNSPYLKIHYDLIIIWQHESENQWQWILDLTNSRVFFLMRPSSVPKYFNLICIKWNCWFSYQVRKEGRVLFNDALNTFYLRLYGVRHMVTDHSDSEIGNPLLPHGLVLSINSKGSFICTIPQRG